MRNHLLRAGLVMPYTFTQGAISETYPESFWCVGRFVTDGDLFIVQALYRGWRDVAAYEAGLGPIPFEKFYQFDGATYDEITALVTTLPTGSPLLAEPLMVLNQRAIAQKDQPGPEGGLISFFETAQPAV